MRPSASSARALEVRKQVLGESHPDHAASQSHLAMLLMARGDVERAELLLNASIAVRKAALGESHPEVEASERALTQVRRARDAAPAAAPPVHPPAEVSPPPPPQSPAPAAPGSTAELLAAVRALVDHSARLGAEIEEAGRRLKDVGLAPRPELMRQIHEYEREYEKVRAAVSRRLLEGGSEPVLAKSAGPKPEGVLALLAQVEEFARVESERGRREEEQRKTLALLDRAAALRHRDPSAGSLLSSVHSRVDEIRRGWADPTQTAALSDEARQVAEGSHAIVALLRLVEAGEDLPDAEWGRLYRQVERTFGKPLAAASARKRLTAGSASPNGPDAPPRGTSPSQAELTDLALGSLRPALKARPPA
ncbi:MAG: tetratricopeptide repeat protein [Isosphaeraceae bacterium]